MEASDPKGAVKIYLSLARNNNNRQAVKRLAEIYEKGIPGIARDNAEADKWRKRAKELEGGRGRQPR